MLISILSCPVLLSSCRIEDQFIFQPISTLSGTPRDIGLVFEDIFFTAPDGVRLHGWFVPYPDARNTLVWFHGNAGNISHRLENIKLLHDMVKINVFIFDYRGYGRSEGKVSEEGTYLDGEAALDAMRKRQGPDAKKTVLFGRSLGAAVATEMAARFDSRALILETPFASIREMARATFPILPIGPLLQTRYDVVEKIRKISVPLLVLHGDRDEIVPFAQGKMVFDAAPEPKKFHTIVGARHNDTYIVGGKAYFRLLKEFIEAADSVRR